MEGLLLLLLPLGMLALGSMLVEDSSDSSPEDGTEDVSAYDPETDPGDVSVIEPEPAPEPEPEPDPTPEPDAIIWGTAGNDTLCPEDTAREVHGRDGDDLLSTDYLDARSSTLLGEGGNDTLRGNDGIGNHASSAQDMFSWHVGLSDDTLDGGDGDDLLLFDLDDVVTGGPGADMFDGYVNQGHTAVVTDFDPTQDQLRVNFDPVEAGGPENGHGPAEHQFGNVSIAERDGDTLIQVNGVDVLRVVGATGLKIGYETNLVRETWDGATSVTETPSDLEAHHSDGQGELIHTDLDGNEISPAELDVILNVYYQFFT